MCEEYTREDQTTQDSVTAEDLALDFGSFSASTNANSGATQQAARSPRKQSDESMRCHQQSAGAKAEALASDSGLPSIASNDHPRHVKRRMRGAHSTGLLLAARSRRQRIDERRRRHQKHLMKHAGTEGLARNFFSLSAASNDQRSDCRPERELDMTTRRFPRL